MYQVTKIIALSYGIDTLTDDYFVLSQSTRLSDRQTDRQTDGHIGVVNSMPQHSHIQSRIDCCVILRRTKKVK